MLCTVNWGVTHTRLNSGGLFVCLLVLVACIGRWYGTARGGCVFFVRSRLCGDRLALKSQTRIKIELN